MHNECWYYDLFSFPRVESVKENTDEAAHMILVGNKSDLSENRAVSMEEAQELANSLGMIGYIETSVKDNVNVKEAFDKLLDAILGQPEPQEEDKEATPKPEPEVETADESAEPSKPEKTEEPAAAGDKVNLDKGDKGGRSGRWCAC